MRSCVREMIGVQVACRRESTAARQQQHGQPLVSWSH